MEAQGLALQACGKLFRRVCAEAFSVKDGVNSFLQPVQAEFFLKCRKDEQKIIFQSGAAVEKKEKVE